MFLVPEGEKLAFDQVQIQSGVGIFNPFLFHHAKPQKKGNLPRNPFGFINQSPDQKKVTPCISCDSQTQDLKETGFYTDFLSFQFFPHVKPLITTPPVIHDNHKQLVNKL
jgi:hypothetical protein